MRQAQSHIHTQETPSWPNIVYHAVTIGCFVFIHFHYSFCKPGLVGVTIISHYPCVTAYFQVSHKNIVVPKPFFYCINCQSYRVFHCNNLVFHIVTSLSERLKYNISSMRAIRCTAPRLLLYLAKYYNTLNLLIISFERSLVTESDRIVFGILYWQ